MTSPAQTMYPGAEVQFLESLRTRYEAEGFTFTIHPEASQLPDFLGSYRPDAIARKPGLNVAIEVRSRPSPATQRSLVELRKLFRDRAEWQFHVAYMGSDPMHAMSIPVATPIVVRNRLREVMAMASGGYYRAAFILAWSLLEAAMRASSSESVEHPRTPGTVVQTLAENGYIDPETERRLRDLIELRNRIVHGDLSAEPSQTDVDLMVAAVESALTQEAA